MGSDEFKAALERLRLPPNGFADLFRCAPADAEDWESGRRPVPRRVARELRALIEARTALTSPRHPVVRCPRCGPRAVEPMRRPHAYGSP